MRAGTPRTKGQQKISIEESMFPTHGHRERERGRDITISTKTRRARYKMPAHSIALCDQYILVLLIHIHVICNK